MIRSGLAAILLVFCLTGAASGQYNGSSRQLTIRTNPFSPLEVDGGIQLGIEYRWNDHWAFAFDPMYVFLDPTAVRVREETDKRHGIKIRADIRYFFDKPLNGYTVFIAPEIHLKYVKAVKWDEFGINCIQGNCDYYMYDNYRQVKREAGAGMKFGTQLQLFRKLMAEAYLGLGIKYVDYKESELPLGGSFLNGQPTRGIFDVEESATLPYIPGGIKLCLRL